MFSGVEFKFKKGEDKMNVQSLVLFLVIGVAAGWLAGRIMKGGGFGLVGDLIIGVIGALLGGWLFGLIGIAAGGYLGDLVGPTLHELKASSSP